MNFEEDKHPRDSDGKFAEKESAQNSGYDSRDDLNNIRNAKEKQLTIKDIKNKTDFVDFIEQQTGVKLSNEQGFLNEKRNLLYTKIPREKKNSLLNYLHKQGFETSEHMNDNYWIKFKPTK